MQTIVVTGTDCYALAAKYLGDVTQFIRIMQQNGLTDPVISGAPIKIVIPDVDPSATGGIASQ